ncbi:MAG TPA: hypothetical protein EYN91_00695 [Candidatus Melainabacteria bacterium]|jgi:hypothetical protein|nr:hypothetical protein [Candidatus Melainabacteria bacterium]HIN65013.1 hypothetical protein [Candidatus Obscuribacterales bacterium]
MANKKNRGKEGSGHEADHDRVKEVTEAGDIGDEQCPAGEIKTDKVGWNYKADKVKKDDTPDELKDFISSF